MFSSVDVCVQRRCYYYANECFRAVQTIDWWSLWIRNRVGRHGPEKTDDNISNINNFVRKPRRLSVGMIAGIINVLQISHDRLNMTKVHTKTVPISLSREQKDGLYYIICKVVFGRKSKPACYNTGEYHTFAGSHSGIGEGNNKKICNTVWTNWKY